MAQRRVSRATGAGGALFVAGVLLLAVNLRPAVTTVPSILSEIGHQLHYSDVVLTVVTTVPVLCFGLFSPVAAWLGRRFGDERALGGAIGAIAVGLSLRGLFPLVGFFPGTILSAAGIAAMNVLLSSLVKRRAPERAAQLLGTYVALLNIGAMVGSAVSVPLYRVGHHSISLALGIWAAPAVAALILWGPQLGRHTVPDRVHRGAAVALRRSPLAWWVTGFMGLQSLTYYASLSFLPEIFRSRGLDPTTAGLVNTATSAAGLISALFAPTIVQRYGVGRAVLLVSTALGVVGIAGTLVVPLGGALPLMGLLGLSQGVNISLALYFMMARAATPAVAGALSGMAQGVGYVVAAAGPLAIGLLHTATGSWDASVGLIALLTVATLAFGLEAVRERVIAPDGVTAEPVVTGSAVQ